MVSLKLPPLIGRAVFKNTDFRKWQNSISGSDKNEIFIYKVPFTLNLLVELIHNCTIALMQKNKKIGQVNAFKNEPQSKFCHFRNTKK